MSIKFPNINFPNPFKQQRSPATPQHLYSYKTRFSMLGTVASGKSTISALIVLTAQTLSSDLPGFKHRTIEQTSAILSDASRLRMGRFPEKTRAYNTYASESGLLMKWEGRFGSEKIVHVPICDIAGEDIQVMIQRYSHNVGMELGQAAYSAAINLINYVKDSDGFILVVPASKALAFKKGAQLERESEGIDFDPDVNLARILSNVFDHKEQSRGKPIKGIGVVITKWDLMMPYAENMGMDIYDPSGRGLTEFMNVCFPATSSILKYYGMENVRFFPSYVELERSEDGAPKKWPDSNSDVILVKSRRQPSYPAQQYVNLINWLKTFAT